MPGCQPWRRSPVCVQHAVSTHPVPSSGSGCPAVWCAARLVSSPSAVQPVRCPVTWVRRPGPTVRPSGVHPSSVRPCGVHLSSVQPLVSAPVRPDASVSSHLRRWRWGPDGCGGATCTTGTVEVPVAAAPSSGSVNGRGLDDRGRRYRGCALVGGVSAADPAGLGEGGGGHACPLPDQTGQAGVRSARGWRLRCGHGAGCSARLPHRWRGCRPGLGARPRWVVVVEPEVRVNGPGRADGLAGGDGRAAPARPRLAASLPGSLPTAL
jgi:hypothetical protein